MSTHLPIPIQSPSGARAQTESPLQFDQDRLVGDRFDQMFGSMRGTMTIVGDIVNPDPEMWSCERD